MNDVPCDDCQKPTTEPQTCETCGKTVCPECERNDENLLHSWCAECAQAQADEEAPELAEWQKHVARTDGGGTSWCGQRVDMEWHFQDAEHALLTVAQGQRLQPCPACMDAMMAQLRRADRGAFPPLADDLRQRVAELAESARSAEQARLAQADRHLTTLPRAALYDGTAAQVHQFYADHLASLLKASGQTGEATP